MTEIDNDARLAAERRVLVKMTTERALKPRPEQDATWDATAAGCNAIQINLFHLDELDVWDTSDAALAVIEHLGQTFEGDDPERAVEALGKVMCFASILAYIHGMSIAPILELAREFTRRPDVIPLAAMGRLAAVVRMAVSHETDIVEALALCIAKGIDDCEMLHGLRIDPSGVYLTIGREMLAAVAEPVTPEIDGIPAVEVEADPECALREARETALASGGFRPIADLVELGLCPQCGSGVSQYDAGIVRCRNGHQRWIAPRP